MEGRGNDGLTRKGEKRVNVRWENGDKEGLRMKNCEYGDSGVGKKGVNKERIEK